jgi:hypothetical protein
MTRINTDERQNLDANFANDREWIGRDIALRCPLVAVRKDRRRAASP